MEKFIEKKFFYKNIQYICIMLKSYKYLLLPNDTQKQELSQFFGSARFVYNLGLETKISAFTGHKANLSCFDLIKQMVDLKHNEASWLAECPSQVLQMSLRNLDNAYTNFFRGNGFPKFKSKHSKQSIQLPQGVKVNFDKNTIFLPKLKNVNVVLYRKFKGEIKTVTVSKTVTNKYFVSILVDNQDKVLTKKAINDNTAVGIDMGIKTFATLSDGTSFANPNLLRINLRRLRIEQRTLARRFKKGVEQSKNYKKQKLIVALLHERISNQRTDYLHKTSTSIIRNYDTICLEDLNIKGMIANHKLAASIGEIGWNYFENMLKYKAEWYGKNLNYIGRFVASSKICSSCGAINKELKLSHRNWVCKCGEKHDRDQNAAINIKNFGLRVKPLNAKVSQ